MVAHPIRHATAPQPGDPRPWALVAHLSHELRTPLNAALGFAELLESDPGLDLPQDRKAWLTHMATACRHVVDLVQGLLELSRLEQGVGVLACRPLDVHPLVVQAIGLLQPAAHARNVTLHAPALPHSAACPAALADPRSLRQALLNLIGNAVKYNRLGGRVDVVVSACDDIRIDILDTGRGLAPSQLANAFEPFNRLGAEDTEVEGSGLGLAITRRLLQGMGGSVALRSEVGVGTCATVVLPRAPAAPA